MINLQTVVCGVPNCKAARLVGICGLPENASWIRSTPSCEGTSVSPTSSHSTNCSTLIIYHPGLVQKASQWPTYQVSPHTKKLKKEPSICDPFLPNPLQFSINKSFYYSMLYTVDTDGVVERAASQCVCLAPCKGT
jgi:hypothetical protein